jgi:hypothetical protein
MSRTKKKQSNQQRRHAEIVAKLKRGSPQRLHYKSPVRATAFSHFSRLKAIPVMTL